MLKQKEFHSIVDNFSKNNMEGYKEWFNNNVNCEVKDETSNRWRRGIRLHSTSEKYAIIVIEGFNGTAFRVKLDSFRMIEGK